MERIVNVWKSITGLDPNLWVSSPPSSSSSMLLLGALVRLPTLVFDIGVAGALYFVAKQIGASTRVARLTCLAWLLNPYATFAVEMIGTPDIAATFMTVIMALFLLRKKLVYAGLALAAGTALKLYPILLLPMALAYSEQSDTTPRARAFFVAGITARTFCILGLALSRQSCKHRVIGRVHPGHATDHQSAHSRD